MRWVSLQNAVTELKKKKNSHIYFQTFLPGPRPGVALAHHHRKGRWDCGLKSHLEVYSLPATNIEKKKSQLKKCCGQKAADTELKSFSGPHTEILPVQKRSRK